MQWTLNGESLPVVEYYTYLGLEFGLLGLGRWTPAIRRLLGAARNRTRQLLWANGNARGLDPALQVRLWNTPARAHVLRVLLPWNGARASHFTVHLHPNPSEPGPDGLVGYRGGVGVYNHARTCAGGRGYRALGASLENFLSQRHL